MAEDPVTYTMTIDGAAVGGGATIAVENPATGEVFAEVPDCTRAELDAAMSSAQRAFLEWREDEEFRAAVMGRCAQAVEDASEELARLQTLEQGQPLTLSRNRVREVAGEFRRYAALPIPREVVQDDEDAYVEVVRRPLGVIAAIKPWNGPVGMAITTIAPAFRIGCTVVLKPSPFTPVATLYLGEVLRAVLPPGVLNVISGADPLGAWMVEHPIPRGVAFTGSVATGKKVNVAAAADLKRVVLELGGNDAAIVLDDVDPDELAERMFWTIFRNSGQVCMAVKRLYVPEEMHDAIAAALARVAGAAAMGDGMEPGVELGPLTNAPQFARVQELVAAALDDGATPVTGGHVINRPGYFFEPTVLTGVAEGSRIVDEEQFGPVLPIMPYHDLDEAVARANATKYGLGASVWSSNLDRAAEVAARLEGGTVWINTHSQMHPNAPFGGVKWSGLGSKSGVWSLNAFSDPQTVWSSRRGRSTYPATRGN
jgi:acyl-CoA reductase-like NAD-dependent aldehyde dehydrogenase